MKLHKDIFLALLLMMGILASPIAVAEELQGDLVFSSITVRADYEPTNALRLKDLKDRQDSVGNKSTLDMDIYPGSKLQFEIEMESTFRPSGNSSEDRDIKDIEITLNVEEIDDEEDIERKTSEFTLEPGDARKQYITIDVPQIVKATEFNVRIDAAGKGKNGRAISKFFEFKLPVKKAGHDIRIKSADIDRQTMQCGGEAVVTAKIYNAGREKEEVKVGVKNDKFGLNLKSDTIKLVNDPEDEGIENEQKFTIKLPENASAGDYPIAVNIYWNGIVFNTKNIDVKVTDCKKTTQQMQTASTTTTTLPKQDAMEKSEEEDVPVILPSGNEGKEQLKTEAKDEEKTDETVIVSKELSFRKSPLFWPLIIGLNLILLIAVAGIAVILVKRKKGFK